MNLFFGIWSWFLSTETVLFHKMQCLYQYRVTNYNDTFIEPHILITNGIVEIFQMDEGQVYFLSGDMPH